MKGLYTKNSKHCSEKVRMNLINGELYHVMYWKTQYCENVSYLQINLYTLTQSQSISQQNFL